jgi:hypothetical protein
VLMGALDPQIADRCDVSPQVVRDRSLGCVDEFETEEPYGIDRDRGMPRGTAPPTPPGIRVRTAAVRPS